MNEQPIKIPGTTFSLQLGFEGKYYAVFLVQYHQIIKSKKTGILKGSDLSTLSEEVEKSMNSLLETEQIFINPVIIDRVVNELLEQNPIEKLVEVEEKHEEEHRLVPESVKVSELIKHSDYRAGKTSITEYHPEQKSKFDATADSISNYGLRTPKPLASRVSSTEEMPVTITHSELQKTTKSQAISSDKDNYNQLDQKITSLNAEISGLLEQISNNNKEITNLKKQVTTLKKQVKDLTKT
ncbi:MAG: coiled-coil domain-containing protein [Candidatus Thorarchaeota archaeon]